MHTARLRVTFLALFAAVAATLVFAVPASAATKPYSLVICALGSSETCAPSPTSNANQPAGVPAAASGVSMTAAFLNENKPGTGINLGSANLTAPTGFTVNGASLGGSALAACTPSTPSTTSCLNGNTIELRSVGLVPGAAVTLSMTVNTPTTLTACTVASPCSWTVVSKQSNDFSGLPGNDLSVDLSTSTLNTVVLAALQFSAEPHSARIGQAITDSDYNPPPPAGTGGPVKVAAVDANGTPVGSYQGPVTVQLNPPALGGSGAVLGGTSTCQPPPATGVCVDAVSGVASFSDLTVNVAGNGYTLTASTPEVPSTTSEPPFNVQQAEANCANGASCSAEATSANAATTDGGIDVTVTSTSGAASQLVESIDFGTWSATERISECGGASDHFTYQAFTSSRPLSSTITTTDLELTHMNLDASVSGQEICLAETHSFTAKVAITGDGDNDADDFTLVPAPAVTLPDGTAGFAGLEPDCGTGPNQVPIGTGPCVTSRSGQVNKPPDTGGTLTITDSSPFDRWIN